MSDTKVKISELPSVSEVLGTDESPAVQSSTTKKFTMTQLGSYILGAFSGLSLGGVLQTAKAAIDAVTTALGDLSDFIGNTAMGTTATTVTGAIAEHGGDITTLNNNLKSIRTNSMVHFVAFSIVNGQSYAIQDNGDGLRGLLIVNSGTVSLRGMYLFGIVSAGTANYNAILTPTSTNFSITTGNHQLIVTNDSSTTAQCILMITTGRLASYPDY